MTRFASRLAVTLDSDDHGGSRIALSGVIDEFAELMPLVERTASPVTVDLGGVEFINSVGVRQWTGFLRALLARGPVTLRNCSEPMVLLFNMATVTVDGAVVESLQAPYACTHCSADEQIELVVARDLTEGASSTTPEFPCKSCSGSLRFAGLPRRYLAFLESE